MKQPSLRHLFLLSVFLTFPSSTTKANTAHISAVGKFWEQNQHVFKAAQIFTRVWSAGGDRRGKMRRGAGVGRTGARWLNVKTSCCLVSTIALRFPFTQCVLTATGTAILPRAAWTPGRCCLTLKPAARTRFNFDQISYSPTNIWNLNISCGDSRWPVCASGFQRASPESPSHWLKPALPNHATSVQILKLFP